MVENGQSHELNQVSSTSLSCTTGPLHLGHAFRSSRVTRGLASSANRGSPFDVVVMFFASHEVQ